MRTHGLVIMKRNMEIDTKTIRRHHFPTTRSSTRLGTCVYSPCDKIPVCQINPGDGMLVFLNITQEHSNPTTKKLEEHVLRELFQRYS
jgi:hypothetical protein